MRPIENADQNDLDMLIHNLATSVALAQSLRLRSVNRLLTMALIDLGQDIAAAQIADTHVSDHVA